MRYLLVSPSLHILQPEGWEGDPVELDDQEMLACATIAQGYVRQGQKPDWPAIAAHVKTQNEDKPGEPIPAHLMCVCGRVYATHEQLATHSAGCGMNAALNLPKVD